MKRQLSLITFFLCSLLTFAQFSGSGSGTENDPYLILNPIQLNQMRNYLNQNGVYFKLMADIDLTDYLEDENPTQGWQPIGTSSTGFSGVFDGNGKTISGLWIKRESAEYIGLFGNCKGATIKNLSIKDASVKGKKNVGILAGNAASYNGNTDIQNCNLSGRVEGEENVGGCVGQGSSSVNMSDITSTVEVSGGVNTGGLVGWLTGKMENCVVSCSVKGNDNTGGLCGKHGGSYSFFNCIFEGNLLGDSNVGGILGYATNADISCCVSLANINARGNYIGGVAGYLERTNSTMGVTNCYFSGSIIGNENIGGLVGYQYYGHIEKNYSNANITGTYSVGGICGYISGYFSTIRKNVVIGSSIKASEGNVARVYGRATSNVTIGNEGTNDENKCYNRIVVISQGVAQEISDDLQNGTGVSLTTLKYKATYVGMGWDFNDIWSIQETESFPYMKRQTAPPVITSDVVSGATTVSGICVDGGTITLEVDGTKQQMVSFGNEFSFTVPPLQAGHEVRVSAKANDKEPSYYVTKTVAYLGKGTETEPYLVYTASDLTGVYRKGYFKLMNDIDLTEYINQFSPVEGWESIGRQGSETIHFDGNGHTISGLWCNTTRDNTGLFSCFDNGTIKNLTVEVANGKQVKGGNNTGILIGKMTNGTIENCNVTGVVADGTPVGGMVGLFEGGRIFKCKSSVTITTTQENTYIGGLVGEITDGEIDQCFTTGTMTGTGSESYVGGMVGKNSATITNCYSTALINSSYNAAGLVAYNYGIVEKCYATGDLHSSNYVAGVIGYNDGENAIVKNCVAMNNIIEVIYESQQSQQGGGYGQRIIGGLKNSAPAPEMNNYALKTMQVSVNNIAQRVYDDIMNGIAKTQTDLMSAATYQGLGWDFSSVWGIDGGVSYPFLQWENEITPVTEITLDKTTLSIEKGKEATITANITPQNATNKQLNWTSSNEDVATVENGVVTAVAVGTATITAAATDGSGVTATCQVTVTISKEAAIAALQELVAEAQTLYDNSTEGENIGDYAPGSRAALLAVINNVNAQISSTMSDEAISQCTEDITAAIAEFQNQQVTAGEDTDYSTIANTIYLERVEAAAGSQVTLSVKMKNTVEVQGYQFDLYLPDGVTVATDEDGFSLIELSTARTTARKTDYFNSTVQPDGSIRVLCGSSKGYTFEGTDGEVATITLNIDENMEEGDHPIILKEVNLTDKNSTLYTTSYLKSTLTIINFMLGDVNGNKKVEVSDFIATANYILGNPPQVFIFKAGDLNGNNSIEVSDFIGIANIILSGSGSNNAPAAAPKKALAAGPKKASTDIEALSDAIYVEPVTASPGTQQTLSIQMKNSSPVAGFEFRLQLPEGITVATDDDILMAELSTARTTTRKTDYFNSALQPDGTLQVLCGTSTANPNTGKPYTFSGNEGEVALITVNIPEDYAEGVYEVSVLDAAFSDADNNLTEICQTVTTELTVGDNSIVLDENSEEDIEATDGPVKVVVKRTLKKDQWSTICLPFDMTEEQVYAAFGDDVQLQEFDSYDPEYDDDDNVTSILVHFTDADLSDGFYGNYPYVIKVSEDISEFTVTAIINPLEDDCYSEYDNGRTGKNRHVYGTFYGTFHAQTVVPENGLFLSDNKFWYSTGKTKMKAFRGWFEFEDVLADVAAAGANIGFIFDGTTGIREIREKSLAEGAVYTLQGQYLGKDIDLKKLPRGIYIVNGKKQVIK